MPDAGAGAFRRIVVGVEGAGQSRDALRLGSVLAGITGAEVLLVHVYPVDAFDVPIPGGDRRLAEHAEELLAGEARHAPDGARTLAVAGTSPARALQRVAEAEGADLLVVSSSRHGRVGRLLLGDGARQVVHHAPCAVAVAPRGYAAEAKAIETVGVGYDASPDARLALAAAQDLARAAGASLRLTAALAPPFEGAVAYTYPYPVDWSAYYEKTGSRMRRELDAVLPGLGVPATGDVRQGWAAKVLGELSLSCDLLVIGSRHWGAVNRLLLGSTATALVGHAHCPLLIVPRAAEHDA